MVKEKVNEDKIGIDEKKDNRFEVWLKFIRVIKGIRINMYVIKKRIVRDFLIRIEVRTQLI